jgi:HPt (histidine-containing phosphotransfer) domain-containing protein
MSFMEKLKSTDIAEILATAGGDRDLARDLIRLFFELTGQEFMLLNAAVKASDAETACDVAHKCAGSSSTCGMMKLAFLLKNLETACVAELPEDAEQQLLTIREEFDASKSAYEQFFHCPFSS